MEIGKCRNCQSTLSEMKNNKGEVTCLRCLKCHPITEYVPTENNESRYVDVPWTEDRIIEIIDRIVPDMVRGIIEGFNAVKIPDESEPKPDTGWREKAKEFGISVYDKEAKRPRLKIDVLEDIERSSVGRSD